MTNDPIAPIAGTEPDPIQLTALEARILGCLIEKEATTPEAYPLTANAVVVACNQKSNREPIMEQEPGEVGHVLRALESRGLVRAVHGARAQRYEHRFTQVFSVTVRQQALLALLLLRGPQTLAELHSRSERLAPFPDIDELRQTLERLAQRKPTLVVNLGRLPGQREDRYMHLLSDTPLGGHAVGGEVPVPVPPQTSLASRITVLEAVVAGLQDEMAEIRQRL